MSKRFLTIAWLIFSIFALGFIIFLGAHTHGVIGVSSKSQETCPSAKDKAGDFVLHYNPGLSEPEVDLILRSARNCSRVIGEHPDLFLAHWAIESGFDPDAIGSAGEMSVSQTHPEYWWCSSMDLKNSLQCGCMVFIFYYLREKGNLFGALVGYNGSRAYAERVIKLIPKVQEGGKKK